jgi:hypothetical protein
MTETKQKRTLWGEESLRLAMDGLKNEISQRKISEQFGIPRHTLPNHIKTGSTKYCRRLERKSFLSAAKEAELVNRVIRFCKIGMPFTPKY